MTKSNEVALFYPLVSIHLGIQFQNSISFDSIFLTSPSLWSPEFPVVWIWPLLCHSYYVDGSLGAYLDFFRITCLQLTVSPVCQIHVLRAQLCSSHCLLYTCWLGSRFYTTFSFHSFHHILWTILKHLSAYSHSWAFAPVCLISLPQSTPQYLKMSYYLIKFVSLSRSNHSDYPLYKLTKF